VLMTQFDWSRIQPAEALETSRTYRFRPEWRPLLLQYFGIAPGMQVLEVGCGPGTFAPYLAEGVSPGRVTGLDLDERFIERARQKAEAAGIPNLDYVVGSAYDLPFSADSFDAVVSYTGLGVLRDPERALAEMIRVCRPGGTIAAAEAITGPWGARFAGVDSLQGHAAYPSALRYHELRRRLEQVAEKHLRPREKLGHPAWPPASFFALLSQAGLEAVRLNAWGYIQAPDDPRFSPEERQDLRESSYRVERQGLEGLLGGDEGRVLSEHGFSADDLSELLALAETRHQWLLEHPLYDWEGGISIVTVGRKSVAPVTGVQVNSHGRISSADSP